MASSLDSVLIKGSRVFTHSTDYRGSLESLRRYFLMHPSTETISPTKELLFLYRGDLMGLLLHYGARMEDHYIIMRVNDLTSMHSVDDNLAVLHLPDVTTIHAFKQMYMQINKINK